MANYRIVGLEMEGFWEASIDDFSRRKTMKSALVGMFLWSVSCQDEDWYEDRRVHKQEELNSGRDLAPHFWLVSEIIMSLACTNCHILTRIAMTDQFWDFEGSSIPLVCKLSQQTMILVKFCC